MKNFEEKRKMLQIEEKGIWGITSVKIPTFRPKEFIISKDEYKFYRCLEEIYKGTDIKISIQVALNQILEANTRRYYTPEANECITNKFKGLSIDFVLFNIKTCQTVCCIELNGIEHEKNNERIERDTFLKETFEALKLPLIIIKSQSNYKQNEIKQIIEYEIQSKESK